MPKLKKLVHPAQYSPAVVDAMVRRLEGVRGVVLDPFAGAGMSLHRFEGPQRKVIGIEIEPVWANWKRGCGVRVGDARHTGLRARSVAAIVTSCCYGNRFSDHHNARDSSTRRSYTHDLRAMTGDPKRTLKPGNAGAMRFRSKEYKELHTEAWAEMFRIAKNGAMFLLNVSDFIEDDEQVPVSTWHLQTCQEIGWRWVDGERVSTPRMRKGKNYEARVDGEWVFELRKP